jgi:hypothetical protein
MSHVVGQETIRAHMRAMVRGYLREICASKPGGSLAHCLF